MTPDTLLENMVVTPPGLEDIRRRIAPASYPERPVQHRSGPHQVSRSRAA